MKEIWPNFFIVGAAKAGTTSLYHYLSQHPDVYMSPIKEPHFFSQIKPAWNQKALMDVISNEKDYLKLFENAKDEELIGEASPSYLWDKNAYLRIKEKIPSAKIIIILRDPIERAFSHYLMDVRQGIQRKNFYDALKEDFYKKDKGWGVSHLYVELGLYFEQVNKYFNEFGSENIYIITFEKFINDINSSMKEICQFLSIDISFVDNLNDSEVLNSFAMPRSFFLQQILNYSGIKKILRPLLSEQTKKKFRKILLKSGEKEKIENNAYDFLYDLYKNDVSRLKRYLNDSARWKNFL